MQRVLDLVQQMLEDYGQEPRPRLTGDPRFEEMKAAAKVAADLLRW